MDKLLRRNFVILFFSNIYYAVLYIYISQLRYNQDANLSRTDKMENVRGLLMRSRTYMEI